MQLQMAAAMIAVAVMAAGTMAKCRGSVKTAGKSMANMMLKHCRCLRILAILRHARNPAAHVELQPGQLMDGALDLLHPQHDARRAGAVARAAGPGNHDAAKLHGRDRDHAFRAAVGRAPAGDAKGGHTSYPKH